MMPISLVFFFFLGTASANAEELWLAVAASDISPAGIAQKAKKLNDGKGIVVQSRDCGDRKNVFAWVVDIAPSAKSAKKSLKRAKVVAPESYVKKCQVAAESLLAFRQSAVDISIADVPRTVVNWEDKDRISTIQRLENGKHILISRYFDSNKEDALEGRRERVILIDAEEQPHELEKSCTDAGNFVAGNDILAFQCAREQAGDELLHSVLVFGPKGKKMKEIVHCRNPLLTETTISCDSESVGADGKLNLERVERRLERGRRR